MTSTTPNIVEKVHRLVAERQQLLDQNKVLLAEIESLKVALGKENQSENNIVNQSTSLETAKTTRSPIKTDLFDDNEKTNISLEDQLKLNQRIDEAIDEIDQCIDIISKNHND